MLSSLWEVQQRILAGATAFGSDPGAPYVKGGTHNHLHQYHAATRNSTKTAHALGHCLAMAKYAHAGKKWPVAMDWLIAAMALITTDAEQLRSLEETLFQLLWMDSVPGEKQNWGQLKANDSNLIDSRIIGATFTLMINIADTKIILPEQSLFPKLIDFVQHAMPDLCRAFHINRRCPDHENLAALRKLTPLLDETVRELNSATSAHDIHLFCNSRHNVTQSLNNKVVSSILSPFLPPGFAKNRLPIMFNELQELRDSSQSRIAERCKSCLTTIGQMQTELEDQGTWAARFVLLPLVRKARDLVMTFLESSDVSKPAALVLFALEKKYPFKRKGSLYLTRFGLRNDGPGPATEIDLRIELDKQVHPNEVVFSFSGMGVETIHVDFEAKTEEPCDAVTYLAEVTWTNYGGYRKSQEFMGSLLPQATQIEWAEVARQEPYSLEPVGDNRPFYGRETDLHKLIRSILSPSMGSAIIHGEKRVGKTSLAKELIRKIAQADPGVAAIYFEGGAEPTAEETVRRLGQTLCRRIAKINRAYDRIPQPVFATSLSPLVDYVDEVLETEPGRRFLLILDEFDELPLDLYKRGPMGDAFFLTLRSLSGKTRVGVVLVGGEKISLIVNAQGDQLNKFADVQLDYFDREDHWTDFQQLIRGPSKDALEFSEDAIEEIYNRTDGNPFFANIICREVFQDCRERQDGFVTNVEIGKACAKLLRTINANSFLHFWEDGIMGSGSYVEEVSVRRRRILVEMAHFLRTGQKVTLELLKTANLLRPLNPADLESEVRRFIERRVLKPSHDVLRFRVLLFEQWLRETGPQSISIHFTDREERQRTEEEERESYVTSSELLELTAKWGTYKGRSITEDYVRAWLDQFPNNRDKRVMLQVLRSLKFYGQNYIREKLREAMGIVRRDTVEILKAGERHRRDIVIASIDGPGKSGATYARLFAQENKILRDRVVDLAGVPDLLTGSRDKIQAIVIVDDFVGTGDSASEGLTRLAERLSGLQNEEGPKLFYIAVCGFQTGADTIQRHAETVGLKLRVYLCDIVDRAFLPESKCFLTASDLERAREIASEKGHALEPKWPLGFGGCEALVVFDDTCPNNTLPIIWKESKDWKALFPRL
jgi:hypothetical protein